MANTKSLNQNQAKLGILYKILTSVDHTCSLIAAIFTTLKLCPTFLEAHKELTPTTRPSTF